MKTYSTSYVIEKIINNGVKKTSARSLLHQLRNGLTSTKKDASGKTHKYQYSPVLEKDLDWKWDEGNIIYTESGLKKILEYGKK